MVTNPSEEATTMEFPYCPQATHAELANRFDRLVRAGRRRRTRRPTRRR